MTGQRCGAYADHADHIHVRNGSPLSALKPTGSTRRWRRIRRYVLERDGYRCQMLVDPETGAVLEDERPATEPTGPDDPLWLRATCPPHNLGRGASSTDARTTAPNTHTTRWSW